MKTHKWNDLKREKLSPERAAELARVVVATKAMSAAYSRRIKLLQAQILRLCDLIEPFTLHEPWRKEIARARKLVESED